MSGTARPTEATSNEGVMNGKPQGQFCGRTRREFLWQTGAGFGGLALTGLLDRDGFFNRAAAGDGHKTPAAFVNPMAPRKPKFPAKAKAVIFIICYGVHSLYAESPIHGSAMRMMNSGRLLSGHPCLGSWVTYGLGSENENLPGFVVMLDKTGGPISGPKNWSSGYMPAAYQGVVVRADKTPIHHLALPPGTTRDGQPLLLDRLKDKNEEHLATRSDNSQLMAPISS